MKDLIIDYSELTEEKARKGVFVRDMTNDAYHAYPGVSNSGLGMVERSPAHYAQRSAFKQTRHMEIGTAFHTAILEPERYAEEYATAKSDDRRHTGYKELAYHYGGECTLTKSEGYKVDVMMRSVRRNPYATEVLDSPGYAELAGFVEDPETGVLMRCKFDWITEGARALDVKKTQDCRPHAFSKSIYQYRYHCQEAMYTHIFRLITGYDLHDYQFLAIEENPPCECVMYTLDTLSKAHGYDQYREALWRYAKAAHNDEWEGYGVDKDIIGLPEWVLRSLDDAQQENGMTFSE